MVKTPLPKSIDINCAPFNAIRMCNNIGRGNLFSNRTECKGRVSIFVDSSLFYIEKGKVFRNATHIFLRH